LGETPTTNDWFVTAGMRVPTEPAVMGDLMGSRIYSAAGAIVSSTLVWPGEDRGVSPDGYFQNLALGRLVLDGVGGNLFRFSSATASNAIYVDYLELLNDATNYNFALGVDPDFTIYFANSSPPPEKLDNLVNNNARLRWVSTFAGPQSSTNITYPGNNTTYRFNIELVKSIEIDSDGDGIVNVFDCTPIIPPGEEGNPGLWFGTQCPGEGALAALPVPPESLRVVAAAPTPSDLGLTISLSSDDGEVTLNWNAPAGAASTVEYSATLGGSAWQTLTNLINGPVNTRVTVKDAAGEPLRVYRVRVDAVNQ
ncbi:MAG TPA: fibronectin type III domain-containing protein, partial [Candidatus Acidoferrum sp.]|nr:fibronectin type III domain-containing protein [Candidatus Acidoferrum sp.]